MAYRFDLYHRFICTAITLSIVYHESLFIIPFILPIFIFLIGYLILELLVYGKRIKKEMDSNTWEYPTRNTNKEKKVFNKLIMLSISVYVVILILVYIV
ncbi:hypothetical protein KHQ81_07490 [Mycoplasmatota bacterium]|nr:hypothetical protein KHQ81_07490 [Mycoplasmatota bacterium]